MRTTRMLCLHGYHGSAAILRLQIAPLAAALPAHVELVFVDAPSLLSGDVGWWHEGFRDRSPDGQEQPVLGLHLQQHPAGRAVRLTRVAQRRCRQRRSADATRIIDRGRQK